MFDRPKMGYVRAKIGLTGQFDRRQPGNYLQPCMIIIAELSGRCRQLPSVLSGEGESLGTKDILSI